MAINQTLKAQSLAFEVVLATEELMAAVRKFDASLSEYTNSGVQFTDEMFLDPFYHQATGKQIDLTHLDAATINTAGIKFIALLAWMKDIANGASVAFDKVAR